MRQIRNGYNGGDEQHQDVDLHGLTSVANASNAGFRVYEAGSIPLVDKE
jgi:hypothetical protein